MGGRNWDRPSFRTRGRLTESISGADVPAEFRNMPQSLPKSKAELRSEAEAAIRVYKTSHPVKEDRHSGLSGDEKPPWED